MVIVYKSIEEKVPVAEQFKWAQIDKTSSLTVLLSITVSDDVLSISMGTFPSMYMNTKLGTLLISQHPPFHNNFMKS